MKNWGQSLTLSKFFVGIICVIVVMVIIKSFWEFDLVPAGVKHLVHMAIMPKDLFDPIVKDKFHFWEKGYTKVFRLVPKYSDTYAIGFSCNKENIPSGWGKKEGQYKFCGVIEAVFYWRDNELFKELITDYATGFFVEGNMDYYKDIELKCFDIPINGKYKKDISVKLTVVEPDKYLEQFKDSIELNIKVSGKI